LQDVRKEIRFCKKVKLPIIGVIENMSGFVCPKCKVQYTSINAVSYGKIQHTSPLMFSVC